MNRHLATCCPPSLARRLAPFVLAGLVALTGAALAADKPPGRAPQPTDHQPRHEGMSDAARAELRARMGQHGSTISTLVKAVVLLDRPTVAALAGRIADAEVVARVEAGGKGSPPSLLPKDFFVEEDRLRDAARDLAAAAAHREPDAVLADRFATLAHTCVTCHSAYLRGSRSLPETR